MKATILLFTFIVTTASLSAQEPGGRSTVDLSVGGITYSRNYFDQRSGPVFGGRYEYRLWKYLSLEAGVDALWPKSYPGFLVPASLPSGSQLLTVSQGCPVPCIAFPVAERNRVTLVPFGVKGILPLASGRVELYLGGGGAYAWHANGYSHEDTLLAQGSLGGRVAVDRSRHFWLGTSLRTYTKGTSESWITWTGDFGFRFGR